MAWSAVELEMDPSPPVIAHDGLDPLVVNPGRLSILMSLAAGASEAAEGLEFVDLRRQTRLTDGNLACHAKRLADGGLIDIAKQFREGKPVTTYLLTGAGRAALHRHAAHLMAVVRPPDALMNRTPSTPAFAIPVAFQLEEDWVD